MLSNWGEIQVDFEFGNLKEIDLKLSHCYNDFTKFILEKLLWLLGCLGSIWRLLNFRVLYIEVLIFLSDIKYHRSHWIISKIDKDCSWLDGSNLCNLFNNIVKGINYLFIRNLLDISWDFILLLIMLILSIIFDLNNFLFNVLN